MNMNEKTTKTLLFGLVLIQIIIAGTGFLLKNPKLIEMTPILLVITTILFVLNYLKTINSSQKQKTEDVQKLVSFLENPMAIAYTDQITEDFLPIFQAIKEFKFKHNRIITDFSETTATIAENNNNVLKLINNLEKFLGDFDSSVKALSDSLVLVAHIDMSYGEKEVASFLKVNVELDHFKDNLGEFTSLLKQIYSLYINETEEILSYEEKVLKDVTEIHQLNSNQIIKNKEELNHFAIEINKLNSDIGNFTTNMESIAQIKSFINEHTNLFFNVSDQILHLEQNVAGKIQEVESAVTNLDEISEKTRLLALNASIYAAEAGEHGKGFSIIASEMKKLAESAMSHHTKIRKTAIDVNTGLEHLKDSNNLFLERKTEISETMENLTNLSTSIISFSQQITGKIFDTERTIKKIINSVDKIQERIEMANNKVTPAINNCREKLYSLDHSEDLKLRVDKILVTISDFNKQMNNEIPDVFQTLNSIFEKTSITHSNFVLIKDNIEQFLRESTVKKMKQFRYELQGDNVRLFKDSVKILNKSHKALKKIIE